MLFVEATSTRISSVGAAAIGQGDIRVIVNALGTVTPIATVTLILIFRACSMPRSSAVCRWLA